MLKADKDYKDLKDNLELSIKKYVDYFCKKHELIFSFWIDDISGTIGCFEGGYYINFEDIRIDIDNEADNKLFFKWYYDCLDKIYSAKTTINYLTYLKASVK